MSRFSMDFTVLEKDRSMKVTRFVDLYFTQDPHGCPMIHGKRESEKGISTFVKTPSKGWFLAYKCPLNLHESFSDNIELSDGSSMNETSMVLSEEQISVPAGVFSGVKIISNTFTKNADSRENHSMETSWHVPEIGSVRVNLEYSSDKESLKLIMEMTDTNIPFKTRVSNKLVQDSLKESGDAYDNLEKPSQAIKASEKVPQQNLKDAKSYFTRGVAYYEGGKYQEAISDYDKAIELDPKLVEAYINRGGAYWMLGNSKQAIEDYKIAASLGHKKSQDFLRSQGVEITSIQAEERKESKQAGSLPPAPPSTLPSEQEIRQFLYRYINSYNNKSIEGFIAFFSPKAIQNQKDDFEKIRKSYEIFFNQMATIQYRVTIDEIKPQQNSAEVRGQYQLEGLVLKGRKKEIWKGQVRWFLVREDGALKILSLDYQSQNKGN